MSPTICAVYVLCFILFCVTDVISLSIGFIHDGAVNQIQQKNLADLKAFIHEEHRLACHPSPIDWTELQITIDTIDFLSDLGKGDVVCWITAIANCQLADRVDSVLTSASTKPILRLDFVSCPTDAALSAERLEIYRLKEVNKDRCVKYSLTKWLEQKICYTSMDNDMKCLLLGNETSFSLNEKLQDCNQLNDIQWSQKNSSFVFDDSCKSGSQLRGRKLRLTSLDRYFGERRSPYVIVQRDLNGTIIGYKGYCYEIIHALQNLYDFTYEVEIPGDNTYGKEILNGSWNGMIGVILENRADIAVGVFSVTHSRSQVVDFSVGFLEEPATILIPPPAQESRLLVYTKPFQLQVWLALMVFASVLPAFLWYSLKCLWIHQERCPILGKNYEFVLGVLIGQSGQRLPPVGLSPRFFGVVWCMGVVVFASAYVGVLMSFLRFPKLSPIISNLEELPRSQLNWAVVRGTALESLFIEATTGVYKAIGEGLLAHPADRVSSGTDGIQRVLNGSYAYIEERSYLKAITEQDHAKTGKCRFSFVNQEFFKVNFAFALPKASPLKPLLDRKILQMIEAGLGKYWKNIYWPSSGADKCGNAKQSEGATSLTLVDLQGAFLILAVGSLLAFVSFLAENFAFLPLSYCVIMSFNYVIAYMFILW